MAVSREEIVNAIGNLSVLEVVELISDLEKKFGVTAAAPVAAVAAAAGAAAGCRRGRADRVQRHADRVPG